ncbi:MAG: DUF2530 domain-containing protein [Bifidobacteriaceae bacterium]|jgi:hypothetical protein|nr:DUF2530 domain-containing protein [Bifidobacteriaceae bacterium]
MATTRARQFHVALFLGGTALWLVALAVLFVLDALHVWKPGDWLWVCGIGAVLGAAGAAYSHWSWRAN